MNITEYNHPRATTLAEGAAMAALVAEVADGINCRAERYGHRGGLLQPDRLLYPEPPVDLPADLDWSRGGKGATVPLAEACKRAGVKVPVWTACRLDQDLGEEYLRRGSLDFVGMTRRLLADPDLPNKLIEGRPEDIRPCTGCLHCFDMRNRNKKLECRVNATLGRETDAEFTPRPVRARKKVLVVGGGPAGMEAARVAARRGHQVALYEQDDRLGGLVPLAAIVKDLETQELVDLVRYLEVQLEKEGVAVRLRQPVTPELVRRLKPDALVIAAGAAHTEIDLPGARRRQRRPQREAARHAQEGAQGAHACADRQALGPLDAGGQERGGHGGHAARVRARRVPHQEGPARRHRARRPGVGARRRHDRGRPGEPVAVAQAEEACRSGHPWSTSRSSTTASRCGSPTGAPTCSRASTS